MCVNHGLSWLLSTAQPGDRAGVPPLLKSTSENRAPVPKAGPQQGASAWQEPEAGAFLGLRSAQLQKAGLLGFAVLLGRTYGFERTH